MRTRRGSRYHETVRGITVVDGVRAKKTDGGLDVVDLRGESCDGGQSIIHARDGPAAFNQTVKVNRRT
jgi:hypothetical protein